MLKVPACLGESRSGKGNMAESEESLLKELEHRYSQATAAEQKFRRIRWALLVALFGVVAFYVVAIINRFGTMYAVDKFRVPLQQEMEKVAPRVRDALLAVVEKARPVYADLAAKKFSEAQPHLERALLQEWRALSDNLSYTAETELHATLTRVGEKQLAAVEKRFPFLHEEAKRERFKEKWKARVEENIKVSLQDFHDKYRGDIERLRERLEKFRPNDFEKWTKEELTRYFVHLWIVLLDRAILGLDQVDVGGEDGK